MKISLAWVFDYIDASLSDFDIKKLVYLFNTHTAEIEHFEKITLPIDTFFMVQVAPDQKLFCQELHKNIELPARSDLIVAKFYMIKKTDNVYTWVSFTDLGGDKEGLLPAIHLDASKFDGSWKNDIAVSDYIVEVDNKSINHRPDLWGHYGIAREIAAILDVPLKPLQPFLSKQPVLQFDTVSNNGQQATLQVALQDMQGASRFAGLYCDTFVHQDSDVHIAFRLVAVGAKAINGIVDLTNYVMFDIGHPMHAFDADIFSDKRVVVRKATSHEKLVLLDEQTITLTAQDVVIANAHEPVSLAGIMGGFNSRFLPTTKRLFLEAAGFCPTTIRKTAGHFKLRTEASMRFEKHLDPMQNVVVLQRFLFLAKQLGIIDQVNEAIVSVGIVIQPKILTISHQLIEKNIGCKINPSFVVKTFQKLGFGVDQEQNSDVYVVQIPTFRITKDISIVQDLVEEVVRMFGYDNISYCPVSRLAQPFDTSEIRNIASIKQHLAFACRMHEVRDYLFFDESFLKRLRFAPEHVITVRNSISENWMRLVTSLVPHLIKTVEMNVTKKDNLSFFEWNRIWHTCNDEFVEQSNLSGIFFDKKMIDFYAVKAELQSLFDVLGLRVVWRKPVDALAPWYDQYRCAQLYVKDQHVGTAGMVAQEFLSPVLVGQAFVFELDGDFLAHYTASDAIVCKPWSKYQSVTYDVSLLVPVRVTADTLKAAILQANALIISVEIVDFFEKEEWGDKRALTFRYVMSDATKTLQKQDIDQIVQAVDQALRGYDVVIR